MFEMYRAGLLVMLLSAGCDAVFGLERPGFATSSVYTASAADLTFDGLNELVVLDRTPGAFAVHIVIGKPGALDAEIVTIPLGFAPISVRPIVLAPESLSSLLIGGERDRRGALAITRQRTRQVFDPPLELEVPDAVSAITDIDVLPQLVSRELQLGLISGGRALITRPFALTEPSIETSQVGAGLTPSAALRELGSELWIVDDGRASQVLVDSAGVLAAPVEQTWDSAAQARRFIAHTGAFGLAGYVHSFSAACAGTSCALQWDAVSATAPHGAFEIPLGMGAVTQVFTSEMSGGDNEADVVAFGAQPDGDEVATVIPDLFYDGASFTRSTGLEHDVFTKPCLGAARVAAVSAAPLIVGTRYQTLVVIDTDGTGHPIALSGECLPVAFQLPR